MAWCLTATVAGRLHQKLPVPASAIAAAAVSSPIAFWAGCPQGRVRSAATWLLHMNCYEVLFALPYDRPDKLRRRLHPDGPRRFDTRLGFGVPIPQRLQGQMRHGRERLSAGDRVLAAVYWSWEVVPHAVLGWVLWRHPERFARDALRLGAVFDATLLPYTVAPSLPPWWASLKDGAMDGQVRRLADEVLRTTIGRSQHVPDENRGGNPWCTMPSNHFASTAAVALLCTEIGVVPAVLGWSYAAALGFALVYLGEHYLGDNLAGGLLAGTVYAVTRRLRP